MGVQKVKWFVKIVTYNFELYFFLIFPLEKERIFKSLFCGMNVNSVNIFDCLTKEKMPVLLDGITIIVKEILIFSKKQLFILYLLI